MLQLFSPILKKWVLLQNSWAMTLSLERVILKLQSEQIWECYLQILRGEDDEDMCQLLSEGQMGHGL